jgi:glycosyltransferase involved in cell wall biosynthesis
MLETGAAGGAGAVLIISHDVVGDRMAGPGIRYFQLARVLAGEFPVVLAVPPGSTLIADPDFRVLAYASGEDPLLIAAIAAARTVLVPAVWLSSCPALLQPAVPVVVDGYDPFQAELLFLSRDGARNQQALLAQAYLAGDFFICASERQRDWWLGTLEAHGRINAHTYGDDPSLRSLVDLVPFGLPDEPPHHDRQVIKGVWPGIGPEDHIFLWGGGLWPWLDPLTAIRALAIVWRQRRDVRLVFPGTRHPNAGMAGIPTHLEAATALAAELGLLDQGVFFGDWLPYADWPSALLECDLAVTLHFEETLESRLAFRSRILDCVWAGLPVIATEGDTTSELIGSRGLGCIVKALDPEDVARCMLALLETPAAGLSARFAAARQELTWTRAAAPLTAFCRRPRRAADKSAADSELGNPYYLEKLAAREATHQSVVARLQEEAAAEIGRLTSEAALQQDRISALQARVTWFERRRVIHLMDRLHRLRARMRLTPGPIVLRKR